MRPLRISWTLPLVMVLACGGQRFVASAESDGGSSGGQGGAADATAVGAGGSSGTLAGTTGEGGASGALGGAAGEPVDAGGGGAPSSYGDCDTAADCQGGACVPLTPGGYRVCVRPVTAATVCSNPKGECCKTSDCRGDGSNARCVVGPVQPACTGGIALPTNVCASDACASERDCPGPHDVCVPAGALGRKSAQCMEGSCRLDRDCTAEPGGSCVLVSNPCCGAAMGLFCIYGAGDCRGTCPVGDHCAIENGRARCLPGVSVCPL